jgi:hypothetical protein
VKICNWCDQVIQADEEYTEVDKLSPSAAGTTLYRHARPCQPAPTQTSQCSPRP